MIASIGTETLDDAFRRVRDLDVSLQEQLRAFAETVKRERPEFAAEATALEKELQSRLKDRPIVRGSVGEMATLVESDPVAAAVYLETLANSLRSR